MRFDLTLDEVDLLTRLCSGCDDMDAEGDTKSKQVAMRLERYFRRRLAAGTADRRIDLTLDEVDLLTRLCSGCDGMDAEGDAKSKRVAMRLERAFRHRLSEARDRQGKE